MIPGDLDKENSVDWAINQLTEEYLAGRIKAVMWGIVTVDGSFVTCWSKDHFLELMGVTACLMQDMNRDIPRERTHMNGEDEDEGG